MNIDELSNIRRDNDTTISMPLMKKIPHNVAGEIISRSYKKHPTLLTDFKVKNAKDPRTIDIKGYESGNHINALGFARLIASGNNSLRIYDSIVKQCETIIDTNSFLMHQSLSELFKKITDVYYDDKENFNDYINDIISNVETCLYFLLNHNIQDPNTCNNEFIRFTRSPHIKRNKYPVNNSFYISYFDSNGRYHHLHNKNYNSRNILYITKDNLYYIDTLCLAMMYNRPTNEFLTRNKALVVYFSILDNLNYMLQYMIYYNSKKLNELKIGESTFDVGFITDDSFINLLDELVGMMDFYKVSIDTESLARTEKLLSHSGKLFLEEI